MDWGQDEFKQPEPLTAQERSILDGLTDKVAKKGKEFDEWMKKVNDKAPSRRIKFSVELTGERLRKMMFLRFIGVEGMGSLTKDEFVQEVVGLGLEALYDSFAASSMMAVMRMAQIMQLPPEIRDAVLTTEIRQQIKQVVDKVNKNGTLQQMMQTPTPRAAAPKSAEDYQKVKSKKSSAKVPQEPMDMGLTNVCAYCNKPIKDERDCRIYEEKAYHTDCLIDYGLEKQKKGEGDEGEGVACE